LILQNPIGQNPNEIILAHQSLLFDFIRLQRAMHKMSSLGHSSGIHASGFELGRPADRWLKMSGSMSHFLMLPARTLIFVFASCSRDSERFIGVQWW